MAKYYLRYSFFLLSIAICSSVNSQNLRVGDMAPKLKVFEWLKGKKVTQFTKGQVYVIEFTGSQCGPCRAVAPHLTKLSKLYSGKVTMVGVCVFENSHPDNDRNISYMKRTREFVQAMGDKMDYNIAVDDAKWTMVNTWLKPANQQGIPCSFIVDQLGKIAWIGHPSNIDPVLNKIVTNGPLTEKFISNFETRENRLYAAENNHNYTMAVKIIDSIISDSPDYTYPYFQKFKDLIKLNKPNAIAFGYQILNNQLKDDEIMISYCIGTILDDSELIDSEFNNLAFALSKRGIEISKDSLMIARFYNLKARIFAEKIQDFDQAVIFQEKSIASLNSYGVGDNTVETNREWLKSELKKYKVSLQEKASAQLQATGNIKGLFEGEKIMIYLHGGISGMQITIFDSAVVENGSFTFTRRIPDGPRLFRIMFSKHPSSFLVLFLDNETIKIVGDSYETLPEGNIKDFVTVQGSKSVKAFDDIENLYGMCFQFMANLENEITKHKDSVNYQFLDGLFSSKRSFYQAVTAVMLLETLQKNPKNQAVPFMFCDLYGWMGKMPNLMKVFEKLDTSVRQSYYGTLMRQLAHSAIQQQVPDFIVKNSKGENVSLGQTTKKGKLTLLYFWSSNSNRPLNSMLFELLTKYNDLHAKGFNIIGVSIDTNNVQWLKAVNASPTPWLQVCDLKGEVDGIAKYFGYVPNVWPFNVLIDEEGKIVDWQVEGATLQYYLNKTFGE